MLPTPSYKYYIQEQYGKYELKWLFGCPRNTPNGRGELKNKGSLCAGKFPQQPACCTHFCPNFQWLIKITERRKISCPPPSRCIMSRWHNIADFCETSVWLRAGCSADYLYPMGMFQLTDLQEEDHQHWHHKHKEQDKSERCTQAEKTSPSQMLSVTKPSPRGHRGSSQKGKKRKKKTKNKKMKMIMTTCKVKNPAERNLNRFGVPQHVESHVKMQTQTTAVKQNGVQLLLSPCCIMHG